MDNSIILRCDSFLSAAEQLTVYQYRYDSAEELNERDRATMLILHMKESSLMHSRRTKGICYSFRIDDLRKRPQPYMYMAEVLNKIPYRFTKATLATDMYGIERIIMHN